MSRASDQVGADDQARQRSFTGEKLDWSSAVNADTRLDGKAFKVAFCIAQHLNRETEIAILSDRTIADKTGISLRCVSRTKNKLRETGWIDWKRTRTANHYWKNDDPIEAIVAQQIELKKRRIERKDPISQSHLDQPPVAHLDQPPVAHPDQPPVAHPDQPTVAHPDQPPVADIHLHRNTFTDTPSKNRAAKTPLPDDWKPSEADLVYAAGKALHGDRLKIEIEKFQQYWIGVGTAKANWAAVWRTWVLTCISQGSGGSRYGRAAPTTIF